MMPFLYQKRMPNSPYNTRSTCPPCNTRFTCPSCNTRSTHPSNNKPKSRSVLPVDDELLTHASIHDITMVLKFRANIIRKKEILTRKIFDFRLEFIRLCFLIDKHPKSHAAISFGINNEEKLSVLYEKPVHVPSKFLKTKKIPLSRAGIRQMILELVKRLDHLSDILSLALECDLSTTKKFDDLVLERIERLKKIID